MATLVALLQGRMQFKQVKDEAELRIVCETWNIDEKGIVCCRWGRVDVLKTWALTRWQDESSVVPGFSSEAWRDDPLEAWRAFWQWCCGMMDRKGYVNIWFYLYFSLRPQGLDLCQPLPAPRTPEECVNICLETLD